MKILHTIADFTIESGGPSTATYTLLDTLNKCGCEVDILTSASSLNNKTIGNGNKWIYILANDNITPFRYSQNIKNFLKKEDKYDIYQTNGLWLYINHITCKIARKKKKPYIITLHGMLYPEAMSRSTLKKHILNTIFFKKDIEKASCIHATSIQEYEIIRNLGYKNPVAVIGNPVIIPSFVKDISVTREKKTIGFLGRLHPIKKIENIIYAVSLLSEEKRRDIQICIMGSGDRDYEIFLKRESERLHLNVYFTGFIKGKDKYNKLASLTVLCMPSNMESFGMTIPEALSVKTPVIASDNTPWESLNLEHCGWWVNNKPEILAKTFLQLFELEDEEIEKMGERGKEMIEHKFNPTKISSDMMSLYKWIINGGEKPEFVYLQ